MPDKTEKVFLSKNNKILLVYFTRTSWSQFSTGNEMAEIANVSAWVMMSVLLEKPSGIFEWYNRFYTGPNVLLNGKSMWTLFRWVLT